MILSLAYSISVVLPQISVVFGLTGALTGSALVYILPPAFYVKIHGLRCCDSYLSVGSFLLMSLGFLLSIVCTSAIIYGLATGAAG